MIGDVSDRGFFIYIDSSRLFCNNLNGFNDLLLLANIRRMNRVPNARIRELCGVIEGVDERTEDGSTILKKNMWGVYGKLSGGSTTEEVMGE